jgi:DNA helicase-2/ATP-dependent DNA helicase PcrA
VNHGDGALLVVAGPGSGKTRVLTERVRVLLEKPGEHFRVLALTFTNKAANEMSTRLEHVPSIAERAFIGTMHSFCTEVLANRGKAVGITGLPHIFESYQDRKQVLQEAVDDEPDLQAILGEARDKREQSRILDSWLGGISDAKNALLLPELVGDEQLRRIYQVYDAGLRASGAVDFDDLLLLTYRLFEERPNIASFYRRQYRYICVDEAQDLNEAQYRVLCALCGKDYFNVIVVGDPKQAIFMWNGAHPKYLDLFVQDFKAQRMELNENFRSSKAVVAAAMALNPQYTVKGQLPIAGYLDIHRCEDEQAEAQFVVNTIRTLVREGHPDIEGSVTLEKCAILGRNRFVFQAVEELLKEQGIAYYKKLSTANYQSVSDVVAEFELALRVLSNPLDRLHVTTLARRWGVGENADDVYGDISLRDATGLDVLARAAEKASRGSSTIVMRAVGKLEWAEERFKFAQALAALEKDAGAMEEEDRAQVMEDVKEWRKHWDFFVRSEPGGHHNVAMFLSQVALGTTQQPSHEGVALLTIHSAKGMEFDVVFVIGMSEGTFPDYRAKGAALVEEGRNAFVAVTRSRRLLYLTYPHKKMMPWGDMKIQQPSRYLKTLGTPILPG